jgi:hypothetical protein
MSSNKKQCFLLVPKRAILLFLTISGICFGQSVWQLNSQNAPPYNSFLSSVAYGNGMFLGVGGAPGEPSFTPLIFTSIDGIIWKYTAALHAACEINAVIFRDSTFVAFGAYATPSGFGIGWPMVLTSRDGAAWAIDSTNLDIEFQSVIYANGIFVSASWGFLTTSTDGTTWTKVDSTTAQFRSVTYGNGKFVAIGDAGGFFSSPNGAEWTNVPSDFDLKSVTFGKNIFVAVGNSIFTSSDGITWKISTAPCAFNSVAYGNNTFVATTPVACGNDVMFESSDGTIWTKVACPTHDPLSYVFFANNQFIAVGSYGGIILTSPDGVTWVRRSLAASNFPNLVCKGNNRFVVIDDGGILTSADGFAWDTTGGSGKALIFADSQFIAVGWAGSIYKSTDGITFNNIETPTYYTLNSVTYGDGTFLTVGDSGIILSSLDGTTWTREKSGTYNTLYSITFGDSLFVAVGDSGTILLSSDHVNWTNATLDTSQAPPLAKALHSNKALSSVRALHSVAYGSGMFVAVGDGGVIQSSLDGATWISRKSGISSNLISVTYSNNEFLATSKDGMVLSSKVDAVTNIHPSPNKSAPNKIIIKHTSNRITALLPNTIKSKVLNTQLFNTAGKIVYSATISVRDGQLNILNVNLAKGMYLMSISNNSNRTVVPFIITK